MERRFPRSPLSFVRPAPIARAIHNNDRSLSIARNNLTMASKARLPDTSAAEEQSRLLQAEKEAEIIRLQEEEESARLQKERDKEALLKANQHHLLMMISETVGRQLQLFRCMVSSTFLIEEQELNAVVKMLSTQLLPDSSHPRALNKILANALVFGNLGLERVVQATTDIEAHVDLYIEQEQQRAGASGFDD